ncbi:acylphosphatase [Fibrobacterota bacterium]
MQQEDPPEEKRLHIIVTGRVQGVGFRFFTKDNADMYNVTGWVRNCANGSVEVEAQAQEEILNKFCEEVRKGPFMGSVSGLQTQEIEPTSGDSTFQIRF